MSDNYQKKKKKKIRSSKTAPPTRLAEPVEDGLGNRRGSDERADNVCNCCKLGSVHPPPPLGHVPPQRERRAQRRGVRGL
jgi:hypothetical protein